MALISVSNNALSNISALPASIPTGSLTLISTQTASASASIEFTSGIDSTYNSYVFKFINIHPATNGAYFNINFSTDGGSNYNVTKTSTAFRAFHTEADNANGLNYESTWDLAQSTADQTINYDIGNDNDHCGNGYVHIFNPSSTTYVKHFIARGSKTSTTLSGLGTDDYVAGYANTTSAINAVKFVMSSGNIDDGIIKMYGVK